MLPVCNEVMLVKFNASSVIQPHCALRHYLEACPCVFLCTADGMRYGTLCVVDLKRRSFSAEMYALLVNFANLVVQGASAHALCGL
jgi:hypothetical protein